MIVKQMEGYRITIMRKRNNIGTSIKRTGLNVMVGNSSAASSQVPLDSKGNEGNLFIPHSLGPPMV